VGNSYGGFHRIADTVSSRDGDLGSLAGTVTNMTWCRYSALPWLGEAVDLPRHAGIEGFERV